VKARHEDLAARGMCDEGAHNAAWEETRLASRCREYLEGSDGAERAVADLLERVEGGGDVVLVCFEGDNKRRHRHLLLEHLRERQEG